MRAMCDVYAARPLLSEVVVSQNERRASTQKSSSSQSNFIKAGKGGVARAKGGGEKEKG